MKLAQLPSGESVFLDANTLVYALGAHVTFGAACKQLLDRIENQDVQGVASAHVILDVAHRIMALEAMTQFSWPQAGIANRLKRHPGDVQKLARYRQAVDEIAAIGIQVVPVTDQLVSLAVDVCQQFGLLTGDALIVVTMRHHNLTNLASNDADFDRVPGITRYAPV
jgi:predicted nucleic acid-binding protein